MNGLIPLLSVVVCWVLGFTALVKGWASLFHRAVAGVFLAAGVLCFGEWYAGFDGPGQSFGLLLSLLSELGLAVVLLYAATGLSGESSSGDRRTTLWRNSLAAIVAGGFGLWTVIVMAQGRLVAGESESGSLGLLGHSLYVFLLLVYVLGIAHAEGLLRTLREPFLYQLKFVLIGLVALACYRIFALSELVFYQGQRLDAGTNSLAVLASAGLVGYGLIRARFQSLVERVYVSPKMLYGSVTFLVIGLYLFGVGIVSQIVRSMGVSFGAAVSVLFVFLALVGLALLLLSRSARVALRTVVARNFYRSKYDYRAKWLEVTDVFRQCDSEETILDRLLELLGNTFSAGRISIWAVLEADSRFHRVRSANTEVAPDPLEASHALIRRLALDERPVAVATLGLPADDLFVLATHAVLCAPIRSDGELLGFVSLSGDVAGLPYGQDDADLLKAITQHVGVLLAHARLAEERRGLAELEALHRFSAFCLHDLKNLAARLSLVAQNAEQHGRDPLFQESAMRTVGDTVQKMMGLMGKLSSKSLKPVLPAAAESVDVSAMLGSLVELVCREAQVQARLIGEPLPPVVGVREQLHQVFLNVVLNAKQAIGHGGEIVIAQAYHDGVIVVTVEDTGCGMSVARQSQLFRPSRSSKPGGLGIGLYQCKQMVEAHHGRIQIMSQEGKGTQVRVTLPAGTASMAACEGRALGIAVHPQV